MERRLVPLTDEIKDSSLLNVRTWDGKQRDDVEAGTSEKTPNNEDGNEKVKDLISKLNKKSSGHFDIFVTKSSQSAKVIKEKVDTDNDKPREKQEGDEVEMINPKCKKLSIKERQTIEMQKKIAQEAEKSALERCHEGNKTQSMKHSNKIDYTSNDKNISLETLKGGDKMPQPASKSPSLILPNVPTRKMLNVTKPKTGIKLNDSVKKSEKCEKLNFDPREMQKELEGKNLKIYKRGDKFYVRLNENEEIEPVEEEPQVASEIPACRKKIHISNPNFSILTSKLKKIPKLNDLSLGKPYGVQLGLRNFQNEKTADLKDLHSVDVILAAHGMACIKHPANWTNRDIDHVLMMGAELYRSTNQVPLDKLSQFTKGFTYREKFLQVTCSEPKVVGKIMSLGERSMDLYNGLQKFFASYRHALFVTKKLDLYITTEDGGFFVFDPRGRNEECERRNQRESALMAFTSVDNLYHVIVNLSNVSSKENFKICSLKITRYSNKINELEEFTAHVGNPNVNCRSNDYHVINDHLACLQGSLSLNSTVFACLRNRHGLTSSIMAMVYSKIDPPVSWSQQVLDRVMHFGYKMHNDCLDGDIIRNLALPEIPSKFYVGDSYLTQICIVPYVQRKDVEETRVVLDNPIADAILIAFKSFRYLLLELDNFNFALWRSEDSKYFFFFDGYQKTLEGYSDTYIGASFLFMANIIDFICTTVINRLTKISENSLKIHGMKIIYLRKLSKEEMKNKKIFKLANVKCIRPFSANDVENLQDSPSTVDSVTPLYSKSQLQVMSMQPVEKPQHLKITDLNSPSLVCCKRLAYHEIMASVEKKLSAIRMPEVRSETMELMYQVHSEILRKITGETRMTIKDCREKSQENIKGWVKNHDKWTPCGELVGIAEKVLVSTDLDCLNQELDEILNTDDLDDNDNEEEESVAEHEKESQFSHFQKLPDGTRIISGTKSLFKLPLDSRIFDYENFSVLVSVAAILTSTKYTISTWSSETIDYVLGCSEIMSNVIKLKNRMDFYTYDEHILPKIHIKEKFYDLKMIAVLNGPFKWLENYLKKVFDGYDRFVIVTSHGSLATFKRNDNFYLFEYATCNRVGYRIKNDDFGSSCLISFDDIHSLVRRINANHGDVRDNEKFLIYRVFVKEISGCAVQENLTEPQLGYIPFSESKENIIIDNLRHSRKMKRAELLRKLQAQNEIIREEKERITNYRKETGQENPQEVETNQHIDIDKFEVDDFEIDLEAPTLDAQLSMLHDSWAKLDAIGYKKECDDEVPRIKGSFAYGNRMETSEGKFKKCHFGCVYAIMYAVHHAFETMNYRSVDVILENGCKIVERIDIKEYEKLMTLEGVVVDRMSYELLISEFSNKGKLKTPREVLEHFFQHQKYGILQGDNCSMAFVKEKNSPTLHVFDPYDTMDEGSEEEIQSKMASWLAFDDLDEALEYFMTRLVRIKEDVSKVLFKIYQVGILSHKALKTQKTGYFLFNVLSNDSKSCEFVNEVDDEKIEWITKTKTIPWSRLEKFNSDGDERYTAAAKWKEYDVEMERKLYSLWGNIHISMKGFKPYAGKQHLACCIVAIIMSHIFKIDEWSSRLLDSIVIFGHKYLKELLDEKPELKELSINDLNGFCNLEGFTYKVDLQLEIYGELYDDNRHQFNLNRALDYAFKERKFSGVILLCAGRSLAIGNNKNRTFFMFDCQSVGGSLFKPSQGTSYVLKCCCMKILLSCIILTLNIKQHGVKFYLYSLQASEVQAEEIRVVKSSKSAKFAENIVAKTNAKEVNKQPEKKKSKSLLNFFKSKK